MTRRSLLLAGPFVAQLRGSDQGASAPIKVSIESFGWLAGRWQGQLSFGSIEEIWSPASEGIMIGMFRIISRGKPSLYEFMTLEQKGEGVCLRIRHFNGQFVAREEKDQHVEFAATAHAPSETTFFVDEGNAKVTLVYRKSAADAMEVDFLKIPTEGKAQKMTFPYRRAAA